MDRIFIFLGLLALVYFLEAIGGSYINSAVQNIERQFQMSSRMSGFMVSASDFGYIPSVVLVAHFGSKGNRARWIGAGAILVSITYLMLASPNFLFPSAQVKLNTTKLLSQLKPTEEQLSKNATMEQLLSYSLIRDRMDQATFQKLLELDNDNSSIHPFDNDSFEAPHSFNKTYTIDGWLIDKAIASAENISSQSEVRSILSHYIHRRTDQSVKDVYSLRKSAAAPFTMCAEVTNGLRSIIKDSKCAQESSNVYPFFVFFISLLFLGIGRTVPWSLGIPLLDDNIKKKSLPTYFGGISFIRILGPICGYLIGSFCNKLYYTLNPPTGLTPADPTWIGAWWIGFIFIGSITLFPSIFMFFFPQGKKGTSSHVQLFDVHKEQKKMSKKEERTTKERAVEFVNSCKVVLSSKIYVGSVIGRVCDILAFKGYIVFLPKYLENHFGIPQFLAHRYMAMFGVFGFGLGTACGGFITRRFRLNGRKAALFVAIVSSINVALYASKMFIGCESVVNQIGLNNKHTNFNFTRECNSQCSCSNAKVYPVCDKTGFAYFSPCHAGCREAVQIGESPMIEFSSCECAEGGIVSNKFCKNTCQTSKILFFLTVLPGSFAGGLGVVPAMLILLRCVPQESRSLSLGLQGMAVSIFGTLPSPPLWGFIIDSACLVWSNTCSGSTGACSIYDPEKLRISMHLFYVIIRLVSLMTDIYVWKHCKNLNILDEPAEVEENKENGNSLPMSNVQKDA